MYGFLDRFWLARQIEYQGAATNDADLSRQYRRRDVFEADLPHLLAEAGQHFVRYGQRCLGGNVTWRGAGAAGSQHQITMNRIDQLDERTLDDRPLVGNEPGLDSPGRLQRCREPLGKPRNALVLVDARRGTVTDRDQAYEQGLRICHSEIGSSGTSTIPRCRG